MATVAVAMATGAAGPEHPGELPRPLPVPEDGSIPQLSLLPRPNTWHGELLPRQRLWGSVLGRI